MFCTSLKTYFSCSVDTWQVSVFTADERSAGTDANVLLVIYGTNSDGTSIKSDEVRLENKGDNFEVGQVDKFTIETIDVGKPYKIRVAHDNSGSFPGWKLDRVSYIKFLYVGFLLHSE